MKMMLYLGLVSVVYEQFQVTMIVVLYSYMEIGDDTTDRVSSLYATAAARVS